MRSYVQKEAIQRTRQEAVLALSLGIAVSLCIYAGGEPAILTLSGACLAGMVIGVAYRCPLSTLTGWVLTTLFVPQLLGSGSFFVGAGVDLRYSDPALLGMAGALLLKLALRDERTQRVFFNQCLLWTLLVGWLLLQLIRSMGVYGVVPALGEFRTYFQHILVVPYVVAFVGTYRQQRRLFWILLGTSLFVLVAIAYANIAILNVFKVKFGAQGNLAVVYGMVALYLTHRFGYWKKPKIVYTFFLVSAVPLTIMSGHRSVWLASAVALLTLSALGYIPLFKNILFLLAAYVIILLVDHFRPNLDLLAFLERRLLAFTAFEEDGTARWRYQIWGDALRQSEGFLWSGKGLGNYFTTHDQRGHLVTTSLHNQYVQLIFQTGLTGLGLYLGFVIQALRALRKAFQRHGLGLDRLITVCAFVVLIAASAFYVPYGFDYYTWLFVGLGLAVAQSQKRAEVRVSTSTFAKL